MRPRRRHAHLTTVLAIAVAALASAGAAAASTAPPGSETAGEIAGEIAADDPFWARASAACTRVLNDHLTRPSDAFELVTHVLADGPGTPPDDATIAGWAETLAADLAHREAIRTALDAMTGELAPRPPHAGAWSAIVTGADEALDVQRRRVAALEGGDWGAIVDAVRSTLGGTGLAADASAVVEASPLRGTDCAVVHSWRMPDDPSVTAEFVTAVTGVCVDVANRRLASGFAADLTTSLEFLATVYGAEPTDDVDVPAELAPALERLVAEWAQTVADFGAIDPSLAPSAEAWAEITAVPAERLSMIEARRDAAASGDAAALLAAYDRTNVAHPAWDWPRVGLEGRICTSLQH